VSSVVGREVEIAAIEAFLGTSGSRPVGLAIVGEPGIGKTTVWLEAVRLAHDRGYSVLAAAPTESEAKLSFAGLADLLSSVPPHVVASLPPPQRAALDVALLRVEAARSPERRLLGTALASLLGELAAGGEVIVAVDDVQWLDSPSTLVVEFALRRVRNARVRPMLSMRATSSALLGVVPDDRLQRLELGPLSVAALHRLFAERLDRSFPRPTLVRIAEASAGNPFYALEIARVLPGSPAVSPLPVPADVLALVRARIRSLPAESRDALLRVAAAARPDLRLVDPAALAAGEEADLVGVTADGQIGFSHPLYASAVYTSAPLVRRRDVHRELAEVVSDPEERARHLALAADGPDEYVADEVEQAARLARARGAPDAAAELIELALRLTPPGTTAVPKRRLELATYLELVGELERAAELLEDVSTTTPDSDLRAQALLGLSELVYRRAGESAASAVAREAFDAARDPILRARCQAALAVWSATVDVVAAATAAREAVEALERAGAGAATRSFALASLVRADLFAGNGLDESAAQRALELEVSAPPAAVDDRVVFKLGQWLRYVDDFESARLRLAEAEQAADEEGDEASLVNILLNRVVLELWAGHWPRAEEVAERLTMVGDQLGVRHASADWRAYLDAHLGRLDNVRQAAALAADRSEPIIDMLHLRALGIVELAAGLHEDANAHLARALALIEQVGFREPAIWRVEGDAVEAAVAVGELERAERLVMQFEQQAMRSGIPWSLATSARCRGLVLAARGELLSAAAALDEALVAHERCPMPLERARTLLTLGRVRRRLKQKRLARDALDAALLIFEEVGAALWAERTREELGRVTTRKAPETLTATEREIAVLAADGLTNQAIAERAFVARKTVEANLARVYRKLGISSRAQLSRALEEHRARLSS
jgi:DNA-binding CsgD family transcriptional regulator